MNLQRRDFLFVVTMAAAVATPVLGQTGVGQGRSPTPSATAIPDFSGIWVHPTLPGFEPPLSGPGPVRNRSRMPNGVGNFNQLVGDYTNPILKPEAAQIVKQHGDLSLAGVTYPTPSNQCWPGGVPYMFWNIEMQMFQRPREITLLYLVDHQVRHA